MTDEREPRTRERLASELRSVGVGEGDSILLHSSMRSLGWVCGGPVAVVLALLDAVGPKGTIVVPSQTPDNRDPACWTHRSVPPEWWPTIREHLPAFDPHASPCREMGLIAETVRTWPGASRSGHPQTSFAAVGARAGEITAVHDLTSELGEASPLAALEAIEGRSLLLGVGYDRCTAFHLAEYRLFNPPPRMQACVIMTSAGRRWTTYQGLALDPRDFVDLGHDFERSTDLVCTGRVGAAEARLLPIREAVSYAQAWLFRNRTSRPLL